MPDYICILKLKISSSYAVSLITAFLLHQLEDISLIFDSLADIFLLFGSADIIFQINQMLLGNIFSLFWAPSALEAFIVCGLGGLVHFEEPISCSKASDDWNVNGRSQTSFKLWMFTCGACPSLDEFYFLCTNLFWIYVLRNKYGFIFPFSVCTPPTLLFIQISIIVERNMYVGVFLLPKKQ